MSKQNLIEIIEKNDMVENKILKLDGIYSASSGKIQITIDDKQLIVFANDLLLAIQNCGNIG